MKCYVKEKNINLHMHQQRPHQTRTQKKETTTIKSLKILSGRFHSVSLSNILIICSDMNAKTGSGHQLCPSVIGKYGKGQINNNGQQLIEMCSRNELYITNTFFDHKMAHRTTWT